MLCKNCGKELRDNSKYCFQCGTIFEEENVDAVLQNQTVQMSETGQQEMINTYNPPNQAVEKPRKVARG